MLPRLDSYADFRSMMHAATMVRRLNSREFSQSIDLLQYAFQLKTSDEKYRLLRRNFAGGIVCGVFESGQLQSQLCAPDLDIALNGAHVAAACITRVSSWPEVRQGGNVSRLVAHALQSLGERGRSVALLILFEIGFYHRLGWKVVTDYTHLLPDFL